MGGGHFHGGERPLAMTPPRPKKSPSGVAPEGQSLLDVQNPRGASVTTETDTTAATAMATTGRWSQREEFVVPVGFMKGLRENRSGETCQGGASRASWAEIGCAKSSCRRSSKTHPAYARRHNHAQEEQHENQPAPFCVIGDFLPQGIRPGLWWC
jgi:hypothetical protein